MSETLRPTTFGRGVAEALEHRWRDRVPGRRRELVDVERHGSARRRGGEKVAVLGLLVELEVRRTDDDDGVGTDLGCVGGQRDRVGRGLRAAVDGDLEPLVGRLEEEIGDASPLLDAEEDPLTGCSQREDPVEPRGHEEVDERAERVVVERAPVLAQRRDRGSERAVQRVTRAPSPQDPLTVAAIRRARVSGRFASSKTPRSNGTRTSSRSSPRARARP